MSTRTSIFIEKTPGVFYGVYKHHDGYPASTGQDILSAEKLEGLNGVEKWMRCVMERYGEEYVDFSESEVFGMWKNSDQEYGYLRRLDGTWEVYDIYFDGNYVPNMMFQEFLDNMKIRRIPGTLEEIVLADS